MLPSPRTDAASLGCALATPLVYQALGQFCRIPYGIESRSITTSFFFYKGSPSVPTVIHGRRLANSSEIPFFIVGLQRRPRRSVLVDNSFAEAEAAAWFLRAVHWVNR
jgi:hypothetical protein